MDNKPQKKEKPLKLSDIPPHLRDRYKDNPIFKGANSKKNDIQIDMNEINRRKIEKEKSIEEKLD
jgi:hypothetical protein